MWDDLKEWLGIILVFVLVVTALFGGVIYASKVSCDNQTAEIGLPHKYKVFGGCLVQEDGKWIPLENWRYFGD